MFNNVVDMVHSSHQKWKVKSDTFHCGMSLLYPMQCALFNTGHLTNGVGHLGIRCIQKMSICTVYMLHIDIDWPSMCLFQHGFCVGSKCPQACITDWVKIFTDILKLCNARCGCLGILLINTISIFFRDVKVALGSI